MERNKSVDWAAVDAAAKTSAARANAGMQRLDMVDSSQVNQ